MSLRETIDISKKSSSARSIIVLRSFNEILGEIGPFQIWTSFLIILSGISISWDMQAVILLAEDTLQCQDPPNVEACSQKCKIVLRNATLKAKSIAYEWNLFCEYKYKQQLAQTVLVAGIMFGCIFYGHMADQIGRRPTFLSACMIVLIGGVLVGLSPWFWFFCLTRFMLGIGCGGMTIICLVFVVEYVDFSRREFMVVMYRLPYTLGHGSLPALAYFVQSWRVIEIVTSCFALIYISYFWLVPESPRWLFITGQLERCIVVFHAGARRNRRPTEQIRNIVETAYDEFRANNFSRSGTMVDLFKTRNLCKKTCILLFAWFSLYFVFYSIFEYLTRMGGNRLLIFGLSAWFTLPGTLVAYPVVAFVPRRYSLLVAFTVSAICMIVTPILADFNKGIHFIMLSAVVLTVTSIIYCIIHLYSTELFPTILRNSGMGLTICCGRFGSLMASYFPMITSMNAWISALVLCSVCVISAILLFFFLPETKGEILPDTIEEGEAFGK